ncbi:hypothetical protein AAFF_G00068980 [Aldrovandia affinis]|uniref:Uncharacterized protein n=1 Tax=Aldrovandia affinis TaxID=143900 RepID=A0AAD7RZ29_9TELE|nr:hypothetical protein AAFF_G00068980 [Aldrovandia affinis]
MQPPNSNSDCVQVTSPKGTSRLMPWTGGGVQTLDQGAQGVDCKGGVSSGGWGGFFGVEEEATVYAGGQEMQQGGLQFWEAFLGPDISRLALQ